MTDDIKDMITQINNDQQVILKTLLVIIQSLVHSQKKYSVSTNAKKSCNASAQTEYALKSAVANIVTGGWETKGVIVNRLRKKYKKEDVEKMIDLLVDHKILIVDEKEFGSSGRFTYKYKLINQPGRG